MLELGEYISDDESENINAFMLGCSFLYDITDEFRSQEYLGNGNVHCSIDNYIDDYCILCTAEIDIKITIIPESTFKKRGYQDKYTRDEGYWFKKISKTRTKYIRDPRQVEYKTIYIMVDVNRVLTKKLVEFTNKYGIFCCNAEVVMDYDGPLRHIENEDTDFIVDEYVCKYVCRPILSTIRLKQ